MAQTVDWVKTEEFYNRALADINAHVTGSGWIDFLDALGWAENSGRYNGLGGSNKRYAGMYQVGDDTLEDLHFFNPANGMGPSLLGIQDKNALSESPIAQDLAAIMEFSGIPDTGELFASKYQATKNTALTDYGLSNRDFERLIGQEFRHVKHLFDRIDPDNAGPAK